MSSDWAANIKLLYPVNAGTFYTIDDVAAGTPFDVIANVEIGSDLNQFVDSFELRVAIRNLTQSTTAAIADINGPLKPSGGGPYLNEERVNITGWTATPGDVLQVIASYKVTAGINVAYSTAQSNTFVVS